MKNQESNHRPRYQSLLTEDGSLTLYSSEFDEAMHSRSGAYDEAVRKHIIPSGILDRGKEHVRVLDVGFGLGYNCLALLQGMARLESPMFAEIISLERDLSALPHLKEIRFNDSRDTLYKTVLHACEFGTWMDKQYSITVMTGDARASIRVLPRAHFDAIFQDAFSPAKNPELWSLDYFRELARIITPSGILTTYSCAGHVRKAMLEAGFHVGKGPSVGPKREGTIATLSGEIALLAKNETSRLQESRGIVSFRDPDLCDSREHILLRRENEMARFK
jgi:tRNA U34 5-methylaminomethyl-2-thiouridine-forming methyltransferase MnmC